MTSLTGQITSAASAGQLGIAAPVAPSTETLCLQLGWSMQRLYRARPDVETILDQLPDRLPGLSRLTRLRRVEIDYGRALACLSEIASALSWTGNQIPDIHEIKSHLDVFQPAEDRTRPVSNSGDPVKDYKAAVLAGHLSLITAIAAAGATLGKAYNLGRTLADTCRPNQDDANLQKGFEPHRLAQLRQDLNDLATVLPAHSAKAVARSLTWWRDAVYMADDSPTGQDRRSMLGSVRTDAPELRRRQGLLNPKISKASSSISKDSLLLALPRQGELWRVVLTGEKKPLDLLTPDDYLEAARRAVAGGRLIATRTILAAPKTTISLFLLLTAVLAGVLAVVEHTHTSGGGKLAAFLIAVGGYFGSLARAAMPRLKSAARAVEQPLWQTALDYVSAEGISVPPVGLPDASGWSRLSVASPAAPPRALSTPGADDSDSGSGGKDAAGGDAGDVTNGPTAQGSSRSGSRGHLSPRLPQIPYVSLSAYTALVTLITRRAGPRESMPSARTCGGTFR